MTPTDAEIAALRDQFGITSNGRGVRAFTNVADYTRAVLSRWGTPAPSGDAEQTYEHRYAIRQGHEIAASNAYFEARPDIDSIGRRKTFEAGFKHGWDAARKEGK